jgi:hypothetical protein
MLNESYNVPSHCRICVRGFLLGFVGSPEPAHVWQDGPHLGRQQCPDHTWSSFEWRIRKRKCPAKCFSEHLLQFFKYRENPLKLSKLAEPIDIPSMQEDDSRSFTFVMVGDPNSVEGRESFHHVSRDAKAVCKPGNVNPQPRKSSSFHRDLRFAPLLENRAHLICSGSRTK